MTMSEVRRATQKSFDDAGTPLADVTFCVLDLETTGGSAADDRITEIGAVKYRGGECLGTFQTLVNPERALPPYITVLTGITESMLAPAPRVESVLPSLLHFIGDSVLVAHNARFDIGFVNAALIRADRDPLTNRVLDTVPLARRLVRDEVPDCKLGTLASRLRLPHQPNHRALDDALATADLLHFLIERASGFGVMGLDDLLGLPRLDTHPLAAKLRLTEKLPRSPGVYLFLDASGRVLYVGKATNLRQRVRSYFSTGETRRKIGALLRQTHDIQHIETPDPFTAGVLELRLIRHLVPHYNRAGTTADKYCYVRLTTDEEWPRLVISKNPSAKGLHLGPLSSRTAARLVVEAIESVVPLRRCTVRMGRNYRPPDDAPVCSAAQLGVAQCPCSGQADPDAYADIVRFVARVLNGEPEPLVERLHERLDELSRSLRFEEAAETRDRLHALLSALARQRAVDSLRRAGTLTIRHDDVEHEFTHGALTGVARRGELFTHLALSTSIDGALDPPIVDGDTDRPLDRLAADEVAYVARHLETIDGAVVLSCTGEWCWSTINLPSVRRADRREERDFVRRAAHR